LLISPKCGGFPLDSSTVSETIKVLSSTTYGVGENPVSLVFFYYQLIEQMSSVFLINGMVKQDKSFPVFTLPLLRQAWTKNSSDVSKGFLKAFRIDADAHF